MTISKIIGILLAIIGLVSATIYTWVGLDNWLSDQGILDSVIACSISLLIVFVGGILLGSFGKKVGLNMVIFGLMGASLLAFFSYLAFTSRGNEDWGEFLMGFVLAGLSMIAIAIMIVGLGMLSRAIITTVARRVGNNTPSQLHDESSESK